MNIFNQNNNVKITIAMIFVEVHDDEIRYLLSSASAIKFIKQNQELKFSEALKCNAKCDLMDFQPNILNARCGIAFYNGDASVNNNITKI